MELRDTQKHEVTIWRLHPFAAAIKPADIALDGHAPLDALRYCGPFLHANGAGFYVYSPIDIDITYLPERDDPWEYTLHTPYDDDEVPVLFRALPGERTKRMLDANVNYLRREKKIDFISSNRDHQSNVLQIWTGCIFETPPGWGLMIRSPINREYNLPFRIDEGILETDWLKVDIWMNLNFFRAGEMARLRRDGQPLAHLVPISRQAYDNWSMEERSIDDGSEESRQVLNSWSDYQHKKLASRPDGNKDSSTYTRERKRHMQEARKIDDDSA